MKELLQQLSAYHLWANNLLMNVIKSLAPELHQKELPSSFNSLQKTVLHMWSAESIWWQRVKLQERIIAPADNFNGNMQDILKQFKTQNSQWNEWVIRAQTHHLEHVFQYRNLKGEQFKQPIYEMLLHLFNHGTYHRGQIVNMLRQLGIEKIPQTDFIVWSRKK